MECLHIFNVFDNLTPFVLGALKRARHVSQSVSPSNCLKKYYLDYALVIHPEKVATRKHVGNGPPTLGTYLSRPTRPLGFCGDSIY